MRESMACSKNHCNVCSQCAMVSSLLHVRPHVDVVSCLRVLRLAVGPP